MNWLNILGLSTVILMLLPNTVYAFTSKDIINKCKNKFMNVIEQIGRYACIFFMTFNIGILEFGFKSNKTFKVWLILTSILLILYWVSWFMYFHKNSMLLAMALAIIPSIIFIESGYMMRHWLLIVSGIIFTAGHIYITYQNTAE